MRCRSRHRMSAQGREDGGELLSQRGQVDLPVRRLDEQLLHRPDDESGDPGQVAAR